jgi:hypothetical protein
MKFSLKSFVLGFICSAFAIGTVTYVNASSNSTIKACANKKTGAMRYIAKGKCKKTEKSLSWNQMGPQGIAGTSGAKGDTGARGDAGTKGDTGTSGANGQNLYAVDSTGQEIGVVTFANRHTVTVLIDGGVFELATNLYQMGDVVTFFRDSACTTPLGLFGTDGYDSAITSFTPLSRFIIAKSKNRTPTSAFKPTGAPFALTSLTNIYEWNNFAQTCTSKNTSDIYTGESVYLTDLIPVSLPSYSAPLSVVSK